VVILMTAFGSVQTAVEAMRIGAFDFVQKPFEIEEMELKIGKALDLRRMKHELDYLRHTQKDIYDFDRIVGASDSLQKVLGVVRKVARSNTTVLVRGETGTGKELIAGAIHHNSLRAGRNFVKVNCAALQENLLESELFGHEKGAFTGADRQRVGRFEQADGGSLFLDEVGDMSPNTQAKILRVLQEHEFERLGGTRTIRVDVRLVAATNRDLGTMVQAGLFREDLYYRLNVVSFTVPALAERREDVVPLAQHFLAATAARYGKDVRAFAPEALELLIAAPWPGNVRQLANAVEQAVALATSPILTAALVAAALKSEPVGLTPLDEAKRAFERDYLVRILRLTRGNVSQAARLAQRNRTEFYKLLERHQLQPGMFKADKRERGTMSVAR
jgi:two-component system response regulator GlrR